MTSKPPLSKDGHVVVCSAFFPPHITGSSVLMGNLLSGFDPASFTVATVKPSGTADKPEHVRYVASSVDFSYKANQLWRTMQRGSAMRKVIRIVEETNAKSLLAVFPDQMFLRFGREAARHTGIPWAAYLHDTLVESAAGNPDEASGKILQEQTFAEARRIAVMSQGMADLYKDKYGLDATPLEHTYPEPVPERLPEGPVDHTAFWGGEVYHINARSFARVSASLKRCGVRFTVATARPQSAHFQVDLDNIDRTYFKQRDAYLDALSTKSILVVAIDWPDESEVHEDELATIFPTKTAEYLASGRPVLVHCPEHYFLARFFRERGCGYVVTDRDPEVMDAAVRAGSQDPDMEQTRRGLEVARDVFSIERVASLLSEVVSSS